MRSYELISFLVFFGALLSFINTGSFTVLVTGIGIGLLIYIGTKLLIRKFGDEEE